RSRCTRRSLPLWSPGRCLAFRTTLVLGSYRRHDSKRLTACAGARGSIEHREILLPTWNRASTTLRLGTKRSRTIASDLSSPAVILLCPRKDRLRSLFAKSAG